MNYAGADWVEKSLKKELSPLGREVADILGGVFHGIYHIEKQAFKTDWSNPYYIIVKLDRGLNLFDDNALTALVVLCHDRMVRVGIRACNFQYIELLFHQRKSRTGSMLERLPYLEDHVGQIRKDAGLPVVAVRGEPQT